MNYATAMWEAVSLWPMSVAFAAISSATKEWRRGTQHKFRDFSGFLIEVERNTPLESRLHQLSVLYSQFRVKKRNTPEMLRSLPASTVEVLYEILDPESKDNPFPRVQTRWRVYVAFSWINVRENAYESAAQDPRYSKPSIKTKDSIRQIPTSETTARIIDSYASNYRGRPQHSFLLNSKSNLPLSTEALTMYCLIFGYIAVLCEFPFIKLLPSPTSEMLPLWHKHPCLYCLIKIVH